MERGLTDEMRANINALTSAAPRRGNNPAVHHYRYNNGRPHYSESLGVSPDQVDEYRAHLKKCGITAEVMKDGTVKIESEKQFREVAKAGGLWNGRDGYGATDGEGNKIHTGREAARGRQQFREMLRKEALGYPSDFPKRLMRRI